MRSPRCVLVAVPHKLDDLLESVAHALLFRLPCLVLVSSTIDIAALSYEGAVIQALMIGGCNSSRCSLVGAAVAAMHGQQSIPEAWIKKVERGAEILAAVEHLA